MVSGCYGVVQWVASVVTVPGGCGMCLSQISIFLIFTLFYITLYCIQRRHILITVSVTYFNRGSLHSSHTSPPSDLLIIRLDTSVIPRGSWINQGDTPHHTCVVSWPLDASAWALDSRDYCHWSSS